MQHMQALKTAHQLSYLCSTCAAFSLCWVAVDPGYIPLIVTFVLIVASNQFVAAARKHAIEIEVNL